MGTLTQLKFTRGYTLSRLKQSADDAWDVQPEGFNNTIRWNVGHILVTTEGLIKQAVPEYEATYLEWASFFGGGTSPGTWDKEPPSNDELLKALKEQTEHIASLLEGKLADTLTEPVNIGKIHSMHTVDEVVQFAGWHEGVHAGVIHGLNAAIGK